KRDERLSPNRIDLMRHGGRAPTRSELDLGDLVLRKQSNVLPHLAEAARQQRQVRCEARNSVAFTVTCPLRSFEAEALCQKSRHLGAFVAQLLQRTGGTAEGKNRNAPRRLIQLIAKADQGVLPARDLAGGGHRNGGLHAGVPHRLDGAVARLDLFEQLDDGTETGGKNR